MDVDDTISYGPETITLTGKADRKGEYIYSVHDFTNRSSSFSRELSLSGARVKVYKGNKYIETYNVPINKPSTLWKVFEIKNGEIYLINSMDFVSNPSNVR